MQSKTYKNLREKYQFLCQNSSISRNENSIKEIRILKDFKSEVDFEHVGVCFRNHFRFILRAALKMEEGADLELRLRVGVIDVKDFGVRECCMDHEGG